MNIMFKDTVNARKQHSDMTYTFVDKRGKKRLNCQKYFSKHALKEQKNAMKADYAKTVGTPIVPIKKGENKE